MILHVDGDAFFASVEQALNPALKGKPVVAGHDRGIAAAISYEAKKYGITRGMPVYQIKELCPHCMIISSSYAAYQLYSQRIFQIISSYCPHAQIYSIDEVFGLIDDNLHREQYEKLARAIQSDIVERLDIPISISIAPTKSLAKIASDLKKPMGCVVITAENKDTILATVPVANIWGIGRRLAIRLQALQVNTAYDFIQKPQAWISKYFSKKEVELWHELRGVSIWPVTVGEKTTYKSIMKTATFPHSPDKSHVYAQLIHNVERIWFRLRKYGYNTGSMSIFLKKQDFKIVSHTCTFSPQTNDLAELIQSARGGFERLYKKDTDYRTTGVTLSDLSDCRDTQVSLFECHEERSKKESINVAVYDIKKLFGSASIMPASEIPRYKEIPQTFQKKPSIIRWGGIRV